MWLLLPAYGFCLSLPVLCDEGFVYVDAIARLASEDVQWRFGVTAVAADLLVSACRYVFQ